MYIGVGKLGHWFKLWFVPCSVPGKYLNQCWCNGAGVHGYNSKIAIKRISKLSSEKWLQFCIALYGLKRVIPAIRRQKLLVHLWKYLQTNVQSNIDIRISRKREAILINVCNIITTIVLRDICKPKMGSNSWDKSLQENTSGVPEW